MNLKLMSRSAMLIMLFSLCSCMKIKPKNEGSKESPNATAAVAPGKVDVSYLAGAANQYQVKLEFHSAPNSIFVTKSIAGIKNSEPAQLNDQVWVDDKVKPGDEIHYEFGNYNQGHYESWGQAEAKVPKDLVIDHAMDLSQKEFASLFSKNQEILLMNQFARIYWSTEGSITLEGQSLQIQAQEIHSENGLIRTFAPEAKASIGKAGRSGGVIEIKTLRAEGHLRIEMRGEGGGDGLPSKAPDLALKGMPGQPGEPGTRGSTYGEGMVVSVSCAKQPTRGLAGEQGHKGYQGNNGLRGGSSGRLLVQVADDTGFSLLATSEVGQGGAGSAGGEGGEGGDGGPAGALPYSRGLEMFVCDQFGGPKGPKGDIGFPGQRGPEGEKQAICEIKNQQPKSCY